METSARTGQSPIGCRRPAARRGCWRARQPGPRRPRRVSATGRLPATAGRRQAARRSRVQRTARSRRRGLPARGEGADGPRSGVPPAAPSSSPMAKRENPLRSRTAGCCATARIWCSTGCGWPPRSWPPTGPRSTSPIRNRRAASTPRSPSSGRSLGGISVEVLTVEPGYVAGEETAAVRAINGGPAKPTDKPPRPFQDGVGGRPTW